MSIIKAIDRAYRLKKERNWDTVYWAIDLHGVCLKSNYKPGLHDWLNMDAFVGMRAISEQNDSKIILWSSVWESDKHAIERFFRMYGVRVDAFNENPFESSNMVSSFNEKFYFSILLDDKAGFDPEVDWKKIYDYLKDRNGNE